MLKRNCFIYFGIIIRVHFGIFENQSSRGLREMDALGRVSANFDKGDIFLTSCLLSCAPIPFWKGKLLKKSIWDQILSFSSRPLSERKKNNLTKLYPLKVYQFPLSPANCIDVLWISFFYLFFVFKGNLHRYLTYIRVWCLVRHYENRPIQIYRKFYLQKLKIFR